MERRGVLRTGVGVVAASVGAVPAAGGQTGDTELEPLGSVEINGTTDAAVQGTDAYVAADTGFAVVDISAPQSPAVVAERRDIQTESGEPMSDLLDCWVWDDRLVIGGPANPKRDTANGFALYDVSDPTAPEQLAVYQTDHFVHNLSIDEGVVYLTGSGAPSNPLVMVDITDDQPEEVGRWSLEDFDSGYEDVLAPSRNLHDVTVQDGIAYIPCWDAGTWIVDVSEPANPTTLAQIGEYELSELQAFTRNEAIIDAFVPPGNAHYTMVNEDGTLLAVGEEAWAVERDGDLIGGPGGIDLYDISTKTEPAHLSRIDPPPADDQTRAGAFTSAHNFDFAGDHLYSSWYYGGVKIHDISDPASPEELGHWQNNEAASFWTAEATDGAFVATSADVSKILLENPPAVREALYVFPGSPGEVPESMESTERGSEQGANDSESDADEASADDSGPGFGIAAAVGGLLGGYHLARRREE